jgi:hypothetical protein
MLSLAFFFIQIKRTFEEFSKYLANILNKAMTTIKSLLLRHLYLIIGRRMRNKGYDNIPI